MCIRDSPAGEEKLLADRVGDGEILVLLRRPPFVCDRQDLGGHAGLSLRGFPELKAKDRADLPEGAGDDPDFFFLAEVAVTRDPLFEHGEDMSQGFGHIQIVAKGLKRGAKDVYKRQALV